MISYRQVNAFADSFDDDSLAAVEQWLDMFGVSRELRDEVRRVKRERLNEKRRLAEEWKTRKSIAIDKMAKEYARKEQMAEEDRKYPGEPPKIPVIGFCPKCDNQLRGMFIQGCETKKSGRVFYKECSSCTYYSELIRKRNKYIEIEGG